MLLRLSTLLSIFLLFVSASVVANSVAFMPEELIPVTVYKSASQQLPNPIDGQSDIYPLMINTPKNAHFRSVQDFLNPLLDVYANEGVYGLKNAKILRQQYSYSHRIITTDAQKVGFALKQQGQNNWGYVTTSIGRTSLANAFMLKNSGKNQYVLILKRLKICFVKKANSSLRWQQGQWAFPRNAGKFECTGSSQASVFAKNSSYPLLLGPYYSETDTVLVFDKPRELKRMVWALKQLFPQLLIPVVQAEQLH